MWRWIDKIGRWIIEEANTELQLRFGVMLTLFSLPFYPYIFWSGEPPIIYFLSVLAVTLTGLSIVVGCQILVKQEENNDDSV